MDGSTLFSGHTLNPPMHTQPSAFSPSAAYRRRISHLLPCVLSKRVHPPTLHLPHAVIHLGTMSEQVNLPSTCPHFAHHTVRDARATCHSARSRSPGLRQKRQGSALPLARVSAWQFCTPDSASTGCQICPLHVERTTMALDSRSGGHWPERDRRRTSVFPSSPCPRREPLAICLCHAIAFESAIALLVLIHPFAVAGSRCAGL